MPAFRRDLRPLVAITLLASGGCLIDSDRCDAHQVRLAGDFQVCVCKPYAVFNASGAGCTPCGTNELGVNGVCACMPGFAKSSADAGCEPIVVDPGCEADAADASCETRTPGASCSPSVPCSDDFPYCVETSGSDGYCSTTGCTSNASCPMSWTCESKDSMRYCRRPLSGLGVSCASSADCASFEASYCETFVTRTCIQEGCATGAATCPNEWACCDFTPLSLSLSLCLPSAGLTNGACPNGGTRVNP